MNGFVAYVQLGIQTIAPWRLVLRLGLGFGLRLESGLGLGSIAVEASGMQ